ncbi:alpha/beta fold hydrolase [Caldimonas sp. KR1-144]|uniref:alpha/beta fold hydrolase n=1 Tax=Caldimonas sp. KR1-144 TaxID=3400911 RepID=UPI003C0E326C
MSPIDPAESCWLAPRDGHRVWWHAEGNPQAPAVLLVHGGPGGRTREESIAPWRGTGLSIIAFDQRGCGRSEPLGETAANTLDALVDDMEGVRAAAGVERWALAAGSWGARLALAYAVRHAERVSALWLRSPFVGSLAETRRYVGPWRAWLGESGRAWLGEATVDAVRSLYHDLRPAVGDDTGLSRGVLPPLFDSVHLALAWSAFDDAQSLPGGAKASGARCDVARLAAAVADRRRGSPAAQALAGWRVHAIHALRRWGTDDALEGAWPEARALARRWQGPVEIVAGCDDATCDPQVALQLANVLPDARCHLMPGAGHRMSDERLVPGLATAARALAARLGFN